MESLGELILPPLWSYNDLSTLLGTPVSVLSTFVHQKELSEQPCYKYFHIKKRSGGKRTIASPCGPLKNAQSRIRTEILEQVTPHSRAMAYRKGVSIRDHAALHTNSSAILRFDIRDFFPSIGLDRVNQLFASFGYTEDMCEILSRLCTAYMAQERLLADGRVYYLHKGPKVLPQGASTSPTISNLVCRTLDKRLSAFSAKRNMTYTRYADDIYLSSKSWIADYNSIIRTVIRIVGSEGFTINKKKTKIMKGNRRQYVTGIVANKKTNLEKEKLRRFRSFLHYVDMSGLQEYVTDRDKGFFSYLSMVNRDKADSFLAKYPWLKNRAESVSIRPLNVESCSVGFNPKHGLYVSDEGFDAHPDMGNYMCVRWVCRKRSLCVVSRREFLETGKNVHDVRARELAISQYVRELKADTSRFQRSLKRAQDAATGTAIDLRLWLS